MSNMSGLSLSACIAAALFIGGCSSVSTPATDVSEVAESTTAQRVNQSYSGLLPCASCPGIETHLDLLSDGTYFLTETYQDRPEGQFSRLGRWEIDGERLLLHHGHDNTLIYFATDNGGWLQADTQGRPIVSQLNYELSPLGWQPAEVSLELDGMLTYMADAAFVVECSTGQGFPVVMTEPWLDIERTYLASSSAGGSYLHTRAQVTLNWETPEEGPARHQLRFQQLKETLPATTCGSPLADLEHHEWDLVELDGITPDALQAMHTRPFVRFSGQQLSGHSGCNVLAGPIQLEGERLTLGPVASTRMLCQDVAEIEFRFLQLLEQASYSSLEGTQWSWYDEDMTRLASFRRKPVNE